MKHTLNYYFIALLCMLFLSACEKDTEEIVASSNNFNTKNIRKEKRVLLVGIDGLQYEKIEPLNTPNFDRLNIVKAYTGGIRGTISNQNTISGPGWMSVLTGVWIDQHQVPDNYPDVVQSNARSIFSYIDESIPNAYIASIATWSSINKFLENDMSVVDKRIDRYGDALAVDSAVDEIINQGPDLAFVSFDNIDHIGHVHGFGSQYNQAILTMDQQLGQLMDAVEQRESTTNEDWLIIIVTDHGRQSPSGNGHNTQTKSERTIFIGMNKEGNQEFKTQITNLPNKDFDGLYGYPAQTAIVPTILRYLGITIKNEWQLNSPPLIGKDGPRKVMMSTTSGNEIFWISNSSGTAEIYRNDEFVTSVPASQGKYTDTSAPNGRINYTIRINNATGSVNTEKYLAVKAALDWNDTANNRTYLFRGDNKYVRYNKSSNISDPGYPSIIHNGNWPGLEDYKNLISAAFKTNYDKGYFFLSNGKYVRYNMITDKVDPGYPAKVTNSSWPGMGAYGKKIIGAVNWYADKAMFFLSDGRYIRYDLNKDKADSGYPAQINNSSWPGMENYKTKITAVADWDNRYMYFFLNDNTCLKYDKSLDKVVLGYPKPINNSTWPGLLNN